MVVSVYRVCIEAVFLLLYLEGTLMCYGEPVEDL